MKHYTVNITLALGYFAILHAKDKLNKVHYCRFLRFCSILFPIIIFRNNRCMLILYIILNVCNVDLLYFHQYVPKILLYFIYKHTVFCTSLLS